MEEIKDIRIFYKNISDRRVKIMHPVTKDAVYLEIGGLIETGEIFDEWSYYVDVIKILSIVTTDDEREDIIAEVPKFSEEEINDFLENDYEVFEDNLEGTWEEEEEEEIVTEDSQEEDIEEVVEEEEEDVIEDIDEEDVEVEEDISEVDENVEEPYTEETFEDMEYREIQSLAKSLGINAAGKRDELIDRILNEAE